MPLSFTSQVFLFFVFFILAFLLLKSTLSTSKSHKNLPSSPPKLPVIGNLHQLGSSPHRALHTLAQTYGPLMTIHFGSVPILVASSVDSAKEILKTHDLTFAGIPHLSIPDRIFYASKNIAFSQYGEYLRQVKSIVVHHLLSNTRVQSYQQVREDEMTRMMEKIQKATESSVNLSELLISLINNVVCRVALGRSHEGRKFKDLLGRTMELMGRFSVGSYIPLLWWVDRVNGLERGADEIAKEFDEFLEGVIEEHINKKVVNVDCQDLVDILLEFQKDNTTGFYLERDMIKAIIMDIFIAGTDTTFTSLEWGISELLRHPEAMNELKQEVHEIGQGRSSITKDDLEKMPYLKAILKETLRLHPLAPLLIPHKSTQDVKLLGYDIPSGTQVLVNAWAIARDPSNWEQPDEFRPERFLNSPIDYKGFHFEFIPFGAGRRGCPGIEFAMNINELVLANLVYKFDLRVVGEEVLDMSETYGIGVHKTHPILISATSCS